MKRIPILALATLFVSCGGATPGPVEPAAEVEPAPADTGSAPAATPVGEGAAAAKGAVALDPVTCDPPGKVDEAVVDKHFEGMLPLFDACYEDVLARDDGLDGDYTVQVSLVGELGVAKCGGYTHVKAGFWIAGFQECLGEHLLDSTIGTPLEGTATCQLVLHFTKE